MGVAAPRQVHIDVRLVLISNTGFPLPQQPLGLHLLTEQIDSRFTDTYYRGGDNNVWKEAWPGLERSEYEYLLETNEDSADVSRFEQFGEALEAARTDWELVQVARTYTKVERMARYWAVDRAVSQLQLAITVSRRPNQIPNQSNGMATSRPTDSLSLLQYYYVLHHIHPRVPVCLCVCAIMCCGSVAVAVMAHTTPIMYQSHTNDDIPI